MLASERLGPIIDIEPMALFAGHNLARVHRDLDAGRVTPMRAWWESKALWEMLQEEMEEEQRRLLVEAYRRLRELVDEGV